ncbi:MAG: alginate export family protein, partial [Deltaproteobacteria bacterium]|nr:alginate export family protein [Deltaproteobacteria bacterium]
AASLHASSGYRFDVPWAPRVVLQYDYASGDRSPDDGANHRFDPLFGARRFEFGPTGLWGAIARSNVSTPGLRLEAAPHPAVDAFAAFRLIWLASARDAWTTAALRDPTGDSGSFVGQQIEARVRWHLFPRNLTFDVGGAGFVRGRFAESAPNGGTGPSAYVYSQVTGTI